jgi:hypothetical protein
VQVARSSSSVEAQGVTPGAEGVTEGVREAPLLEDVATAPVGAATAEALGHRTEVRVGGTVAAHPRREGGTAQAVPAHVGALETGGGHQAAPWGGGGARRQQYEGGGGRGTVQGLALVGASVGAHHL